MIIDSSAIVAIIDREPQHMRLRDAILGEPASLIPAPVLTETQLVLGGRGEMYASASKALFALLAEKGVQIVPFTHRHADITATARDLYGKGNGTGGKLNFGDLLVYAIAKDTGLPLLCTGNDFATTDLVIHPASRLDP